MTSVWFPFSSSCMSCVSKHRRHAPREDHGVTPHPGAPPSAPLPFLTRLLLCIPLSPHLNSKSSLVLVPGLEPANCSLSPKHGVAANTSPAVYRTGPNANLGPQLHLSSLQRAAGWGRLQLGVPMRRACLPRDSKACSAVQKLHQN